MHGLDLQMTLTFNIVLQFALKFWISVITSLVNGFTSYSHTVAYVKTVSPTS